MTDTIFAVSSGAAPAAIAIVRMSGPAAFAIGQALAGRLPPPRRAAVRALHDPATGELLDRALVLVFPAPRTATGEDIVELHLHGGKAVVAAVEVAIAAHPSARRAVAGEFTRRALENGIIDLTAAEGLGDLLAAETETQRRAALRMAEGGLRARIEQWTDRLVAVAAGIEAQLDFADEDDVPAQPLRSIVQDAIVVADEIEHLLSAPPVERLHDGIKVVIAGPPNSGKSTLLNVLAGRDLAIVSPVSGTTRDRIEAPVARNGIAYVLMDTAGLTTTPGDEIERIGVTRATDAIEAADVVIWLADTPPGLPDHIWVYGRCDLPDRAVMPAGPVLSISAAANYGIGDLWLFIERCASALLLGEGTILTNHRQRSLLETCLTHLQRAVVTDVLIVAEELRMTLRTFDAVTGRSGIENILDAVFSRFCIGK